MIKTILIIVISVTIFGLVFFVIVRNSLKRRIEMMVIKEKEEFTKNLVTKIDQENKEKELIEEQNKNGKFLLSAFFTGLGLIFLLLIYQFNSISKPTIIMIN